MKAAKVVCDEHGTNKDFESLLQKCKISPFSIEKAGFGWAKKTQICLGSTIYRIIGNFLMALDPVIKQA